MPDTRWSLACRTVLVLSSLCLAGYTGYQVWLSARYAPYLRLHGLIARGEPVSADAIGRFSTDRANRPPTCRSDLVEAQVAVELQQVENSRRVSEMSGGDEVWMSSVRNLAPVLDHALACLPTSGRLWQQRAVLTWLLGGPVAAQVIDMELSQAYAPADLDVIALRFTHWRRVGAAVTTPAQSALRFDMWFILTQAPARYVRAILTDLPPDLDRLLQEQLANLGEVRRDELARTGFTTGRSDDADQPSPPPRRNPLSIGETAGKQ